MARKKLHIVMLAAENDSLPGGKVGGIGDVIRDVPRALAKLGHHVSVVLPSYGSFHTLPSAKKITLVEAPFRGSLERIEVYELFEGHVEGVSHYILEHSEFAVGGVGRIYCNDPSDAPFASDANKFALFCSAAARAVTGGLFGHVDALHLHDWHTAFTAVLREYDPALASLKEISCIYSVHNLAIQGIRPLKGTLSALESWFPELPYQTAAIADPRWPSCINPMAAAIRLCDRVHTVSKSYAAEILQPSQVETLGFYGGEGLQADLQQASATHRLYGILNGCDYDPPIAAAADWNTLLSAIDSRIQDWIAAGQVVLSCDYLSDRRVQLWLTRPVPQNIITSIGRLTEQKARLFTYTDDAGQSLLDRLLESLGARGVFVLLGSGDTAYEQFLTRAAARHHNFLFLNHYDQGIADTLYSSGDLFLMPSSFEPCGISQMLAMRASQPCLVHAIGGLKDTVKDEGNGFHFSGANFAQQGENLLQRFSEVLELREQHPVRWQAIRKQASEERYLWSDSVSAYVSDLYT